MTSGAYEFYFIYFIFPLEWVLKKGCIMIYNDRNCFFFFQAPKKLMNVPTTVCLSKLHPCYDIVSLTYFKKLFCFYHKMDLVFEFAIRPMLNLLTSPMQHISLFVSIFQ